LTGVADDLLLVAPEVEPPPGFESRVLARLGAGDYVAEARSTSGKVIPLGRFSLTAGHGLLAITVAVDATDVKSVRVSDADGSRVYEAFPAPTPA
jgi:hypothetical protein